MLQPLKNERVPEESKFARKPSVATHKKHLENQNEETLQEMRKQMFSWVKRSVTMYLSAVLLIVIGQMVASFWVRAPLSDHVMIALLVTTTGNVLGLPYLIIKAIFNK